MVGHSPRQATLIEQDLLNVLPGAEKGNELAVARIVEIADSLLAKHKSYFGVERGVELAVARNAWSKP